MKQTILDMEEYAQEYNVPIIEKDSIAFIMQYIKKNNVKNVLEIGSAIGYSAILMASASDDVHVTTIEKDEVRYMECLKNVKKCDLDKRINVVYNDALEVNLTGVQYDLIFIDAALSGYIKYFEKFQYFLAKGGVIVTDNLKFHGYVSNKSSIDSENIKRLVEKIEKYIEFLKNNEEFDTKFYDVGDGLSISMKKEDMED